MMAEIFVTIIEKVGGSRCVVSCALCGGTGKKPGHKSWVPCEVCTGKGVVLLECAAPLVVCRLCSGTGNKPGHKSWVPCDACQGTGAQPLAGGVKIIR